jgi:hypothetical protein
MIGIDIRHAGHLSLFEIRFVFQRVLPPMLRCTTFVSGWLLGGLWFGADPCFLPFSCLKFRDRFAGAVSSQGLRNRSGIRTDDGSRNENGDRSSAIDGVRTFGRG